jgi:hypothetical protein
MLFLLLFLAKVIFNESHWMTANASIIYISYLMSMFHGKTIGLIWDKHSIHYCADVMEFIERCNADNATETRIVVELVDEGLTPIIQVPDVAVNKVFKSTVQIRITHEDQPKSVRILRDNGAVSIRCHFGHQSPELSTAVHSRCLRKMWFESMERKKQLTGF